MLTDDTQQPELVLEHARIVLPDRVLADSSVEIANGRIVRIGSVSKPQTGAERYDLSSLTLFPGFIDVHIHGAVGFDTLEATGEELQTVSRALLNKGVTAWIPTLVPAPEEKYASAIEAIDEVVSQQQSDDEPGLGARVLGVHYEGPFVNELQCGALRTAHFRTFVTLDDMASLPVPGAPGLVKLMTVAPEINGGIELIGELVKQNWIVFIGHTRADVQTLDRAYAAGARHMTHFMNAMAPFHHRAPGPIGWGLNHDEVTCDIIADGVHLDPLILKLLIRVKGAERLALISDAIAAAGMGDGDYRIWGGTISVKNGRTQNARGSIAGSVITMAEAVKILLSLGVSEIELARMAATTPARLIGFDNAGIIEEGKRADLVAVDNEGNVKFTVLGGRIVPV